MEVTYKNTPNNAGYRVGSDGSVWTAWRIKGAGRGKGSVAVIDDSQWRPLKPQLNPAGYLVVALCPGPHWRSVHRLVLEVFVGPCPAGMECCHSDGNATNNALDNLRWDTKRSNIDDRTKHGKHHGHPGESNSQAKLTESIVRDIRDDYAKDNSRGSIEKLAKKHSVSGRAISLILKRKTWAHVT